MTTYFTTASQQTPRFTYTVRAEGFAGQVVGGVAVVAAIAQAIYVVLVAGFLFLLFTWGW